MTVVPNLLILGPPKCATSSLHGWLCQHPDISQGVRKELFFLMDQGHPLAGEPNIHDDGLASYEDLFPPSSKKASIRIDSTTHYLYQKSALEFARQEADLRCVVVLREPAQRVYSSFSYTKHNLASIDPDLSFARYLELVDNGEPLYPHFCSSRSSAWVLERDIEFSRYAHYLQPWIDQVGRERIDIVRFEDLTKAPGKVVEALISNLGLGTMEGCPAKREAANATRAVRSSRFHRLARKVNAKLPIPKTLKKLYFSAQTSEGLGLPTDQDSYAIAQLRSRFANENADLEALTGLDVSAWK